MGITILKITINYLWTSQSDAIKGLKKSKKARRVKFDFKTINGGSKSYSWKIV